jgi:hypothetical protein
MKRDKKKIETKKDEEETQEKSINKEIKRQDKQLRNILIIVGILFSVFLLSYLFIISVRHFEYRGIKFDVVKEKDLIFYNTAIPLYSGTPITGNFIGNYNFYLRKDPRKIGEEIPFKGELYLFENIVINSTEEFSCDGDEVIAVANLANLLNRMGAKVIRDDDATCDWQGKYNFIRLLPGNTTNIRMVGPGCYDLSISNCEILEVTERFMIEIFSKINEKEKSV